MSAGVPEKKLTYLLLLPPAFNSCRIKKKKNPKNQETVQFKGHEAKAFLNSVINDLAYIHHTAHMHLHIPHILSDI